MTPNPYEAPSHPSEVDPAPEYAWWPVCVWSLRVAGGCLIVLMLGLMSDWLFTDPRSVAFWCAVAVFMFATCGLILSVLVAAVGAIGWLITGH